jgi:acyl carrier protein
MLTDNISATEHELRAFIVDEVAAAHGIESFGADEDLIRLGIVDSLGMQQLVDFCESRYGIRVVDSDLVTENFQTLRQLGAYVERKVCEADSPDEAEPLLRRR